jgi:methionyl-tRNA formyltransferase
MQKSNLNIAFFGTPEFATLVVKELITGGFKPSLVVTTPDKPAGRGLSLAESPVKIFARSNDIPVLQPAKLNEEFISELRSKSLDILIVAAYGKILPESVLSVAKHPPLNVHPSLLPKYRGTSPVESQILTNEESIGVSIIRMDKEMDHGPIVAQEKVAIPDWPISRDALNTLLWSTGGELLGTILPQWISGTLPEITQDHSLATFTSKIEKADGLLDLSQSPLQNYLKYLAYEGWPGTYFFIEKDGTNIRVLIKKARFENNEFIIERVIPEGRKEMSYQDFLSSN